MMMLKRLKRLWSLSNDQYPRDNAIGKHFTRESRKNRDQKLATILQDDPLEDEFNEDGYDTTSERTPVN